MGTYQSYLNMISSAPVKHSVKYTRTFKIICTKELLKRGHKFTVSTRDYHLRTKYLTYHLMIIRTWNNCIFKTKPWGLLWCYESCIEIREFYRFVEKQLGWKSQSYLDLGFSRVESIAKSPQDFKVPQKCYFFCIPMSNYEWDGLQSYEFYQRYWEW